jgi:hypothetical protein
MVDRRAAVRHDLAHQSRDSTSCKLADLADVPLQGGDRGRIGRGLRNDDAVRCLFDPRVKFRIIRKDRRERVAGDVEDATVSQALAHARDMFLDQLRDLWVVRLGDGIELLRGAVKRTRDTLQKRALLCYNVKHEA